MIEVGVGIAGPAAVTLRCAPLLAPGCAAALALGCAAALALGCSEAGAEDPWAALGPARIGAARAEIEARTPLHCQAAVCVPPGAAPTHFAGVPVQRVELHFEGERLAKVTILLGEQHYTALRDALRTRFGEGADHSFLARAGMAGEFAAGVVVWSRPELALVLEQYAGKIDRSRLVYGTPEALAELVRAKTAIRRGTLRDL